MPEIARPADTPNVALQQIRAQLAAIERRLGGGGVIRDAFGNVVAGSDTAAGGGLGRPYLPIVWTPVHPVAAFYSTTATTPTAVWQATMFRQHPKFVLTVVTAAEDDATGALRLSAGGADIGEDITFGPAVTRTTIGPLPAPGDFGAAVQLVVSAWRTAGAGAVNCWVQDSYGVQS